MTAIMIMRKTQPRGPTDFSSQAKKIKPQIRLSNKREKIGRTRSN